MALVDPFPSPSEAFASQFAVVLMEYSLKLARIAGTRLFLLVEAPDGRRYSGDRLLCHAFVSDALRHQPGDVEMSVDHGVAALHPRNSGFSRKRSSVGFDYDFEDDMSRKKKSKRSTPNSSSTSPPNSRTLWSDDFGKTDLIQVVDAVAGDDIKGDWLNHSSYPIPAPDSQSVFPLPYPPPPNMLNLNDNNDFLSLSHSSNNHVEHDTSWVLKEFIPNNSKVEQVRTIHDQNLFVNKLSSGSKLGVGLMHDFSRNVSERCRHRQADKCNGYFNRCFEDLWSYFDNLHQLKLGDNNDSPEHGWRFKTLYSNLKWIARQNFKH